MQLYCQWTNLEAKKKSNSIHIAEASPQTKIEICEKCNQFDVTEIYQFVNKIVNSLENNLRSEMHSMYKHSKRPLYSNMLAICTHYQFIHRTVEFFFWLSQERQCPNLGFIVIKIRETITILILTMLVWFKDKEATVMKWLTC